jgi:hypothetical protein
MRSCRSVVGIIVNVRSWKSGCEPSILVVSSMAAQGAVVGDLGAWCAVCTNVHECALQARVALSARAARAVPNHVQPHLPRPTTKSCQTHRQVSGQRSLQ